MARYLTEEWQRNCSRARWKHDPYTLSVQTRRDGDVVCPRCGAIYTPMLRMRFRWLKSQKLPRHKQGREMIIYRAANAYNRPEAAREAGLTVHQWRLAETRNVKTPWVVKKLKAAGVLGRTWGYDEKLLWQKLVVRVEANRVKMR